MKGFFKNMTVTKVFVLLLIISCGWVVIQAIRSHIPDGLKPEMMSPLATGKATLFPNASEGVESKGTSSVDFNYGKATWFYQLHLKGDQPVDETAVLDQIFAQPGVEVTELLERGLPGGIVRALYKTPAGGLGRVSFALKGSTPPQQLDIFVQEDLIRK